MALPVAVLGGCSSAEATEETAAGEEAIRSGKAPASDDTKSGTASDTTGETKAPCHEDAAAQPSCETILAAAFPGPDEYQWEPVAQSSEVVACCDKELTDNGAGSAHRWACCVAYDPTASSDAGPDDIFANGHGMACTPWGPPVPPTMNRARALRAVA